MDDLPWETLTYCNGPGYLVHRTEDGTLETEQRRMNLSEVDKEMFGEYIIQLESSRKGDRKTNLTVKVIRNHSYVQPVLQNVVSKKSLSVFSHIMGRKL